MLDKVYYFKLQVQIVDCYINTFQCILKIKFQLQLWSSIFVQLAVINVTSTEMVLSVKFCFTFHTACYCLCSRYLIEVEIICQIDDGCDDDREIIAY